MTESIVICDKCKKELKLGGFSFDRETVFNEPQGWETFNFIGIGSYHLCPACASKYKQDLRNFNYNYFGGRKDGEKDPFSE